MNKDGSEAVLNYIFHQLNQVMEDMKINEESKKVISTSMKKFFYSEILFNDAKNTFLSQDPSKISYSISNQNDPSQFHSALIPYASVPPANAQPLVNNPMPFISTPINSPNLVYPHQQHILPSVPNIPNPPLCQGQINQDSDSAYAIGTQELLKILNRVSLLKMIDDTPIPAKSKLNDFSKKTRPWTTKEDNRLLAAIMKFGLENWTKISKFVGNSRTRGQCSQRWSRGLNPSISRIEWSSQEDAMLMEYVKIHGNKKWSKISSLIGNRSDVQCRYRYKQLIKKRAQSPVNLSYDINNETVENEISSNTNESNDTTNENECSLSITDESTNDENLGSSHGNSDQTQNSGNLSNPNLSSNEENVTKLPKYGIKPIIHSFHKTNILNNLGSLQNQSPNLTELSIPDLKVHKEVPSLNVNYDIDAFLSKFKET